MAKFNVFKFLVNRKKCMPISDEDMDNFDLFMTQMALSMAQGVEQVLENTNTQSFFKLPKKYQCMCFKSLNGYNLSGAWQKSKKKTTIENRKEVKEKVSHLFDCSENESETYVDFNLIDEESINSLYTRIYEPEKMKIRKR